MSDGDAADCCSALCRFLQCRHQCLWEVLAIAAGLGVLAVMQQSAVLPNIISYDAAISACDYEKDIISYDAAISACEMGRQGQQA